MSSAEVIDALFERTVDIVQSLPKSGPIQTSYEEKLALYSLYKQATEGDVNSKRPGIMDMLARAKWDAWSKRKGMPSGIAKQAYVESMLRVLRKFGDRPQAIALIEELESYSGDVAQRIMSASLAHADSDSEGSTRSADSLRGDGPGAGASRGPGALSEDAVARLGQEPPTGLQQRITQLSTHQPPPPPTSSRPSSAQAVHGAGTGISTAGGRTPQGSISGAQQRYADPPGRISRTSRGQQQQPPSVRGYGGRPSVSGPGLPAGAGALESSSDSEEDSDGSLGALPTRGGGGRMGPGPPPHHHHHRGSVTSGGGWSRGPGSVGGDGSRLYAPPGAPRFPPSESNAAGGAGASLYSAAPPSNRPQPTETHYYHHRPAPSESAMGRSQGGGGGGGGYAPSSVGGRSGGGARGQSVAGGGGPHGSRSNDVDMALQSIQASLAGMHERLSRIEAGRTSASSGGGEEARGAVHGPAGARPHGALGSLWIALFGSSSSATNGRRGTAGVAGRASGRRGHRNVGALGSAYSALADALHDVALLVGLSGSSDYANANEGRGVPSKGGSPKGDGGARGSSSRLSLLLGAPLRLVVALINVALRMALDLTSLGLLVSLVLLVVRRITGKGDPLLLLRIVARFTPLKVPGSGGGSRGGQMIPVSAGNVTAGAGHGAAAAAAAAAAAGQTTRAIGGSAQSVSGRSLRRGG